MTLVKKEEAPLTHFLAVGENCWGKATTIQGAKLQLRQSRGAVVKNPSIYKVPADYYIDEMGDGHGSAKAILVSGQEVRE